MTLFCILRRIAICTGRDPEGHLLGADWKIIIWKRSASQVCSWIAKLPNDYTTRSLLMRKQSTCNMSWDEDTGGRSQKCVRANASEREIHDLLTGGDDQKERRRGGRMGERRHHPHGHGGTTPFFAGLVRGAPAGSLPGGLMPPGTNEAIPSSVPPLGPSGAGPVPPRPKTAARAASNSTTPSCPLTPILHPWSTWEGSYDQEDAFLRRRFSMFGRSSAVESARGPVLVSKVK
ncbi:uncharacterized protein VDAG_01891 [Verticillium dahliae VdLs.17]|uniref:Uncharacterized protein n=1 Tax=Verticillium dahliae (strain VdLs.17 / ATCC MYA-4575 / FGSC 10137) TaxID=498257 RepID=G2WWA5_VERDV|nr:uncharacterized protein VDAG_01891 [Verticillium dahliae VdLs.17]EGY19875.1 hypothetical protein VDAG_01891 [Verticillium dahliae VdLs.17]KAH6685648.1 hypothetical protein EV126DRAFT_446597 [Verticillium dahliae]KAH6706194.1 hypothetical protein EV126DRAFT_440161 [Verticillium dahliae]